MLPARIRPLPPAARMAHTHPISPFRRVRRPKPRPRRPGPRPVWGTFKHWCLGGARTKSWPARVTARVAFVKIQGAVQRGALFPPQGPAVAHRGRICERQPWSRGLFLTYRFGPSRPSVACDRLRISFLWMVQHNAKSPSLACAFDHMRVYPSPRDKQTIRLL